MGAIRGIGGVAGAILLAGCTIVQVGGTGRVAMVRPGVLQIAPGPGAALITYRTVGVGLVPGRAGATLGWSSERAALLYDPAQCRIVILDPGRSTGGASFWRDLARTHPDICVAGEKQ